MKSSLSAAPSGSFLIQWGLMLMVNLAIDVTLLFIGRERNIKKQQSKKIDGCL
ncbi:hypothetical protein [Peribacillus simplex]|uniref:hypothetical protein n=1 Tax=Peribacillus simplex TaxID=1478 RepID=UPI0025A10FB9|nr:hypothetical protein [Peribacillus simplex]